MYTSTDCKRPVQSMSRSRQNSSNHTAKPSSLLYVLFQKVNMAIHQLHIVLNSVGLTLCRAFAEACHTMDKGACHALDCRNWHAEVCRNFPAHDWQGKKSPSSREQSYMSLQRRGLSSGAALCARLANNGSDVIIWRDAWASLGLRRQ